LTGCARARGRKDRDDRYARRPRRVPRGDRVRDPGRVPATWSSEHACARDRRVACGVRRRPPSTVSTMKGPLVVGIDAGGTKTRAFAVDRGGEVVGRGAGGGGNLLSSPDPQGSIGAALAEALDGRAAEA